MVKASTKRTIRWVVILLILIGGGWFVYERVRPYFLSLSDQTEYIAELEKRIQDLEMNQPTEQPKERSTAAIWAMILLVVVSGLIIYIVFTRRKQFIEYKRDFIIKYLRKYAKEKDNISVYRMVKYVEGYYKADINFPIALVLFSVVKSWQYNVQPPAPFIYGYLVDRRNPNQVLEDFYGKSAVDILNDIKLTQWGLRGVHHKAYKTTKLEEDAVKSYLAREEAVMSAALLKREIDERL